MTKLVSDDVVNQCLTDYYNANPRGALIEKSEIEFCLNWMAARSDPPRLDGWRYVIACWLSGSAGGAFVWLMQSLLA